MPELNLFENIQLNSLAKKTLSQNVFLPVDWGIQGTKAGLISEYGNIFIADRAWEVFSVSEVHRAAAQAGTLNVERATSGTAPDSGVNLLSTAFSLTASVNVPRFGTLITTKADLLLRRGDRLVARDASISGTETGLADVRLTILLRQK